MMKVGISLVFFMVGICMSYASYYLPSSSISRLLFITVAGCVFTKFTPHLPKSEGTVDTPGEL